MEYKILESNGVDVENIDGAGFNNFTAGYKNGIVKDILNQCAITILGNNLILDTGLLLIKGFRIKILSPTTFSLVGNPSIITSYQLYAKIILSSDRSVVFEINTRIKQNLIQDDILKNEQGTYEVEIATFNHNTNGNITDLNLKLPLLTVGNSSSSIVVDDEFNLTSENPVQNKVITEALESKLDKVTDAFRIYGTDYQGQRTFILSTTDSRATPGNIAYYLSSTYGDMAGTGHLLTATPVQPYQCANKKYVDEAVAGGGSAMWLHKVHIYWNNSIAIIYDIFVSIISSDSTPINTLELLKANVSKIMAGTFAKVAGQTETGAIYSADIYSDKVRFMYTYNDGNFASYTSFTLNPEDIMEGDPITYIDTPVQL